MVALNITDADVDAEATRRGVEPSNLSDGERRVIKRELAQAQVDAKKKPAADAAQGPDHLTITVEITHGDRVLGVTQQHVPIPK